MTGRPRRFRNPVMKPMQWEREDYEKLEMIARVTNRSVPELIRTIVLDKIEGVETLMTKEGRDED